MPYIGDVWISDRVREANRLNDPLTRASAKLADAVENFLYNFNHPGYQNPDYLGWSVMQFDATKNGSGHRANYVEWSPKSDTEALLTAAPPTAAGFGGQSEAYNLPDHEKRRREETNGPFDTSAADDPTDLSNPDGYMATGPYFGPPPVIDPRTDAPVDLGGRPDFPDEPDEARGMGMNDNALFAPDREPPVNEDTDPGQTPVSNEHPAPPTDDTPDLPGQPDDVDHDPAEDHEQLDLPDFPTIEPPAKHDPAPEATPEPKRPDKKDGDR